MFDSSAASVVLRDKLGGRVEDTAREFAKTRGTFGNFNAEFSDSVVEQQSHAPPNLIRTDRQRAQQIGCAPFAAAGKRQIERFCRGVRGGHEK